MTVVDLQTVQAFFSRSEPIYLQKFQIICGVWTFRTLAFWMYGCVHLPALPYLPTTLAISAHLTQDFSVSKENLPAPQGNQFESQH